MPTPTPSRVDNGCATLPSLGKLPVPIIACRCCDSFSHLQGFNRPRIPLRPPVKARRTRTRQPFISGHRASDDLVARSPDCAEPGLIRPAIIAGTANHGTYAPAALRAGLLLPAVSVPPGLQLASCPTKRMGHAVELPESMCRRQLGGGGGGMPGCSALPPTAMLVLARSPHHRQTTTGKK